MCGTDEHVVGASPSFHCVGGIGDGGDRVRGKIVTAEGWACFLCVHISSKIVSSRGGRLKGECLRSFITRCMCALILSVYLTTL